MEAALPGMSRRVQVRLIQGVDLLGVNDFPKGLSDPVCTIVNRRTGEKLVSRQIDNTVNPRWHQSLFLEDVQLDDILDVRLSSTHFLSKSSTLIGQAEISVSVALRRSSDVLFHPVPWLTGEEENLLAVLNRLALGETSCSTAWTPDASPHQAPMPPPAATPPHCIPPQTSCWTQLHAPQPLGRSHVSCQQPTCQAFHEQDQNIPAQTRVNQEHVDPIHQFIQQQQNLQQEQRLQQQLQQIEQLQQFQNLERLRQQFEKQQLHDQQEQAQHQISALRLQNDLCHHQPAFHEDSHLYDPPQPPSFPQIHQQPLQWQNLPPLPSVYSHMPAAPPYQSSHADDPNLAVADHPVGTSNFDQRGNRFSSLSQSGCIQSGLSGTSPIPYIAKQPPSQAFYYGPLPPSLSLAPGNTRPMSLPAKPAVVPMSSPSFSYGLKLPFYSVDTGPPPPPPPSLFPRFSEARPPPLLMFPCPQPVPCAPPYKSSLYPPSIPVVVPPPSFNEPYTGQQFRSHMSLDASHNLSEEGPGQAHMKVKPNGLDSDPCIGGGDFAVGSNSKESVGCQHTANVQGSSSQGNSIREMEYGLHDAPPVFQHGALQNGNDRSRCTSLTAPVCTAAISSQYESSPSRLALLPSASTEIAMPALEAAADGPMQAFALPPSNITESKSGTPASSSDWSKAGSSCSLNVSNVLSEEYETRSRLLSIFTQMAYSYPLNLTEVLPSHTTGSLPENTKGYLVLALIDSRAPSVDKLFPSNRYKKFNNLKNTFDATKLIGDAFGGKLGGIGKAVANNLAPIGHLLKDFAALKVDVHVGESFPTFKIEMYHVKNVFGSVRQHWNEKYPAAQKIFQAPGARSIVKAQHAAL
jgi:phosphatidylethanolamine-binding protein (PEBP) family uncharacterized protein